MSKREITVNRVGYETVTAAARAYGLNPDLVKSRLHRGWSIARAFDIETQDRRNKPRSLTLEGLKYLSLAEAARAYGLKSSVVSKRLKRGWSEEAAFGIQVRQKANEGKRVVVEGVEYPSVNALARAYDLNTHTVSWRLRNGWTTKQSVELESPPEGYLGPRKIEVEDKTYASMIQAAKSYGLQPDTVKSRLLAGWTVEQALGLEPPPESAAANPVVLEGVRYRSTNAACEAYGVPYSRVEGRVRIGWSLEQAIGVEPPPDGANMPHSLTLEGKEYPSHAEAARAYNLHYGIVKGRLGLGWTESQVFGIEPPPENIKQQTRQKGGVIYRIKNILNELFYFGQTSVNPRQRWYQHQLDALSGSNSKLHQAMAELGLENFEFEIVDEARTGEELDLLEGEYIYYFDTIEHGYNSYQPPLVVMSGEGPTKLSRGKPISVDSKLPLPEQREGYKKAGRIKRYAKLRAKDKIHIGRSFIPFNKAREYVRKLGLKSQAEWKAYVQGKRTDLPTKPVDIPTNPNSTYKGKGWSGLGDWLGTGTIATWQRDYLTYEEARAFVQKLNLKRSREWDAYCNDEYPNLPPLPDNIPWAPRFQYKGKGWTGIGDWLGTGRMAYGKIRYLPFQEARAFVRTLGLVGYSEWNEYCKNDRPDRPIKPIDIPATPDRIYKGKGWEGYPDWLGHIPRR